MSGALPTITILEVPVARASAGEAIAEIERLVTEEPPVLALYVNAHTLNLAVKEVRYRTLLQDASVVLNDGIGVSIAARLGGSSFPENLNGSDFNPVILELAARRGWRVFFLGAAFGVADEAARRLSERVPGLQIAGTRDGFFPRSEDASVAAAIRASEADVVLVAMGNPLQETWLEANLASTGARLGIGVGAFFDFTAGTAKRAPAWMNRAGIEWVWRLALEPGRLWKRYVVGNPLFLLRVVHSRLRKGSRTST